MPRIRWNALVLAAGFIPAALAQRVQPTQDLTREGAVVRGTADVEIIDTRLVQPQIQASFPWTGPVRLIRDHLPTHQRQRVERPHLPNSLVAGGLTDAQRSLGGPLFPAIQQTPWTPPDPTLAVGPDHIVVTVNMAVAFYSKDGTLLFSQNLDSTGDPGFFETVGGGDFTFDPKCFYDVHTGRFVIVALEVYGSSESWIDIAISDDSDPNGIWYKYRTWSVITVSGSTYWVDYPGFGYDQQAFYVTGNLFLLSGGGSGWAGALFRTFDKTPLLSGGAATWSDIRGGNNGSVQVAQCYGAPSAPFFVEHWSNTEIRLSAIKTPLTAPTLVGANVTVPYHEWPWGLGAPNLGGDDIDTLDGRMINVCWRDGNLYCGHGIQVGTRNIARWYHVNTGTWPYGGSPTLVQSGNIDGGTGVHTWFPAIFQNGAGELGLVCAMSSASTYASVQITGRKPSDPLGTMGALTQVALGETGYTGYRWGDFFGACVDPTNDDTFWVIGEYARSDGGWGTWVASFLVSRIPGDMNCDGLVNSGDIPGFVTALTNPASYEAQYPLCDRRAADVDGNGSVNAGDINPFIDLLVGP